MSQLFTASDYAHISNFVFQANYPGYKPNIVESPNGDGVKDTEKKYAHIAQKYLFVENEQTIEHIKNTGYHPNHDRDSVLQQYLNKAHDLATQVAVTVGVPKPFWPDRRYGALRVLEYNGQATTAPHTDFDLFTLMCYRNDESCFRYIKPKFDRRWDKTQSKYGYSLRQAQKLNSQVHFGEILEEIDPNQWLATPHEVVVSNGPWQYSIVYFAIPDHAAALPSGQTVGQWIEERKSRSRYDRQ